MCRVLTVNEGNYCINKIIPLRLVYIYKPQSCNEDYVILVKITTCILELISK